MNINFNELEQKRKKSATISLIFLFTGIALFITSFILFCNLDSMTIFVVAIVSIFVGIVFIFVSIAMQGSWNRRTRNTLLKIIIEDIYPSSTFHASSGLDYNSFLIPSFFAPADRYTSNNYLSCNYKDIDFVMSDYKLENRVKTKNGYRYQQFAKGRFFVFEFKRVFHNTIKITEKGIGDSFFAKMFNRDEYVELESIMFNKKFLTTTSDKLTVFYLLTPQLQEELLKLESSFKGGIYFFFEDNKLYIAINDSVDSFKVSFYKKINNENMDKLRKELNIPRDIIDCLKLNSQKFSDTDVDNDIF